MLACSHRGSALLFYSNVSGRESITWWLFAKTATVSFSLLLSLCIFLSLSPSCRILISVSVESVHQEFTDWNLHQMRIKKRPCYRENAWTHQASIGWRAIQVHRNDLKKKKKRKECIVVMERITLHNNLFGTCLIRVGEHRMPDSAIKIVTICSLLTFIIIS